MKSKIVHTDKKRLCNGKLCASKAVPTSSELRVCLGSSLAKAFFEYSHDDTKNLLNLVASEKTPKPCFTIPIDDRLHEDVASPTNDDVIKANAHENILEIGEDLLECFRKQIEEDLRTKIERQSQEKFHVYQAKKRREAELKTRELHAKYENYIKTVQDELQEQLEAEWANAAEECAKNTQKAVVQERMNVTHDMMQKMRTEMAYVVQSLYREFEDTFRAQRENIIADFNGIMRETHVKLNAEKREFESKVGRDLYVQKHQLQMQSTVDIINTLCLERLRFCKEKHTIHEHFQKQIAGFHELIAQLKDVICLMRQEIINCYVEKKSLEEQLCDVVKQFQKFINFIFHTVPGQAEYLLPLEFQRSIVSDKNKEEKNSKS
ncbi:uncharacterized protein LOC128894618 [Hylaeus anthracinus]|uniref:uncharacterized protein LOC128894618 n=1 Tax=Hylaeus anthracinus TaxID=313031 RepID=UPI0023B91057|nr:uncharacterized protein LOC128894618 [Hylaeus anthracinus]